MNALNRLVNQTKSYNKVLEEQDLWKEHQRNREMKGIYYIKQKDIFLYFLKNIRIR